MSRAVPHLTLLATLLAACASEHAPTVDRLACATCHASSFEEAPLHVERDYPRTCYQCHGTTDWEDATLEHDDFAIDREPHAGYDCGACHLSSDDREDIDCTGCHAHSAGRTDPRHLGNSEYTYQPRSCLRCHEGEEGD